MQRAKKFHQSLHARQVPDTGARSAWHDPVFAKSRQPRLPTKTSVVVLIRPRSTGRLVTRMVSHAYQAIGIIHNDPGMARVSGTDGSAGRRGALVTPGILVVVVVMSRPGGILAQWYAACFWEEAFLVAEVFGIPSATRVRASRRRGGVSLETSAGSTCRTVVDAGPRYHVFLVRGDMLA